MIDLVLSFLLASAAASPTPPIQPQQSTAPLAYPLNPTRLEQAFDRGDLSDALRQIELGWKFQYEDYYQGKLTGRFLALPEIQQRLFQLQKQTGKRTALIYEIPGPKHLDILLVLPQGKPIHRRIAAADRKTLTETIQTFRSTITDPESQPSDYLPSAQKLHRWLIAPITSNLQTQQIDTLIFCMGNGLRTIPLAALHDGKKFLAETYSLSLIPAFGLLDHRPSSLRNATVLAMGASEFKDQQPLPAVVIELATISQTWPSRSLLNQDFTLKNLKTARSQRPFDILHFATHADISDPSANSYLQFWDHPFRLTSMRDLNFRDPLVQLLVLSACRTALGNSQAELGFAGLAVQSGAKAAIASLWAVSDSGSLVLMAEFYRHLKTAPIKAEALRQAQIAMLRSQVTLKTSAVIPDRSRQPLPESLAQFNDIDLSHPYYWAAFSVIGNPW